MTFREKLMKKYPNYCTLLLLSCPEDFDFEKEIPIEICNKLNCDECWSREVAEALNEMDDEIDARKIFDDAIILACEVMQREV